MGLMVVNFVLFGVLFIVPGFIQSVLGHSAVAGGLMLLPMAAATGLGSFAAARASKHPQSAQLALPSGLVLIGIGMGIAAATKVVSGAAPIMTGLTLLGLGQGPSQSFAPAHAMDQVDEEAHGTAAALINTIRQIGSMLGIAILGSLLGNRYTRAVTSQSTHLPEFIVKQINTGIGVAKATAPQFPGLRDQIDATANTAYVTAMDSVLALCSVAVIVTCSPPPWAVLRPVEYGSWRRPDLEQRRSLSCAAKSAVQPSISSRPAVTQRPPSRKSQLLRTCHP